ncbi:MAG: AhpC/TSA family protein [Phycisphaerae bacterium]|nr:AhpC/TSA family protein [Phycisphaerae bacterium]
MVTIRAASLAFTGGLVALGGCDGGKQPAGGTGTAPTGQTSSRLAEPDRDQPGLGPGDRVPHSTLRDADGREITLASLHSKGPVVVMFYRGGWCPYCTRALTAWNARLKEFAALGVSVVAISPERPERAVETSGKTGSAIPVLCDERMEVAAAFGIQFEVDATTRAHYSQLGLDLSAWNASGTWKLAAPGTFLIDGDGVVRYAFADWDYTRRADPAIVLDAARKLIGRSHGAG